MIIGKIPPRGEAAEINKWYAGIEFLPRPPSMYGSFRPYIFVWCFKVLDPGDPYRINGREEKRKGGWKTWSSPFGITIEFHKF